MGGLGTGRPPRARSHARAGPARACFARRGEIPHVEPSWPLDWAATQRPSRERAVQTLAVLRGARLVGWRRRSLPTAGALEERTRRDRVPLAWATTQMNLGNALATLGLRGGRDEVAGAGGGCVRRGAAEQDPERVPLDWARTTGNQGFRTTRSRQTRRWRARRMTRSPQRRRRCAAAATSRTRMDRPYIAVQHPPI